MNPELADYISMQINQGTPLESIKQELLNAGWDQDAIEASIAKYQAPPPTTQQKVVTKKGWLTILSILVVVVIATATFAFFISSSDNDVDTEGSGAFIYMPYNDGDDTQLLQNFCDKLITYSSKWTTSNGSNDADGRCSISFFTYNRGEVSNELRQGGRFPTNVSFWDDIEERSIDSYPYSLDDIYEIQVRYSETGTSTNSMEELVASRTSNPFTGEEQDISGLQVYSLDDREIADYIVPGDGNFVAQRRILVYNKKFTAGYTLTINRSESRIEIEQSEIDELDRFISSLDLG